MARHSTRSSVFLLQPLPAHSRTKLVKHINPEFIPGPPGIQYENSLLQIVPVNKLKCPYVKNTNDVGFQLFTRHNPTVYQELILDDDEKLFASNIDFNDKTILYFHGWMEQPEDGSAVMVREAYMQRGDTNVIMVDAHHLEAGPWYFTAAQNTWYIGRFTAQFIDYLVSRGLNLNNTHLIGHSLGAHIAGVASSSLKSGRVARITALDPALPLFEHIPLEQRLDPSDAHFIDVIHSDAGIFGYKHPTGHVDFYPNGGISPQPGCELEVVIPQQLLLNKCDSRTQTQGFYAYYLTEQKATLNKKGLESKLVDLFSYIHSVRAKETENTTHKYLTKEREEVMNNNNTNKEFKFKVNITENSVKLKRENTNITEIEEILDKKEVHKTDFDRNKTKLVKENKEQNQKHLTYDTDKNSYKPVDNFNNTEFEDQIAEASDFVETRVEFDQSLKEKATLSLLNDSLELILENDKIFNKSNIQKAHAESVNDTAEIKEEINRFNLLKNPIDAIVKELNYKDPCDDTKPKIETTTSDYEEPIHVINKPIIKDIKVKDRKPKVNIFQLLGTTYRIGRILKDFHQKKDSIFNKFKIFKTTTPKSIINQIKTKMTPKILKRQKRFLSFLKKTDDSNMFVKVLEFLVNNRKNVVPVFMVMREINTLVKSSNGELNHSTKEQNYNIGGSKPPIFEPVTYTLELGNENRILAFVKRLMGMTPKGDKLTIGSGK